TARLRVEFALGCAWNSRSGHRGIGARVAVEFALEYAWNMQCGSGFGNFRSASIARLTASAVAAERSRKISAR
ncbi:hypothetical protein, partial [Paraburkholderia tagetis]